MVHARGPGVIGRKRQDWRSIVFLQHLEKMRPPDPERYTSGRVSDVRGNRDVELPRDAAGGARHQLHKAAGPRAADRSRSKALSWRTKA